MPARRTLWLAGAAFAVGLLLALALFQGGAGGARAVVLRIENAGTNDASYEAQVDLATGAPLRRMSEPLAAGAMVEKTVGEHARELVVKVRVTWESPTRVHTGEAGVVGDPAGCRGGEVLVIRVVADTTRGVTFPTAGPSCR